MIHAIVKVKSLGAAPVPHLAIGLSVQAIQASFEEMYAYDDETVVCIDVLALP